MEDFRDMLSTVILPIYEKVLLWSAIILVEYHILWTLMQYVIWKLPYYRYEKWAGLLITAALFLYLTAAAYAEPARLNRVRLFLKDNCSFEQLFLIALLIWYIFVCVVRGNIDGVRCIKHNDNRLFIVWLSAFVLFPFFNIVGRKYAKRVIECMLHTAVAAYTPFCVWALFKYFGSEEAELLSGYKITAYQGSSLMIGGHRNITGASSALLFAICIYMIILKRRWVRLLYIAAAIVHALVLILSNSRTSFASTVCLLISIAVISSWDRIRTGRLTALNSGVKKNAVRLIIGIAVAAVCIALLIYARSWIISMSASAMDESDTMKVRKFTNLSGRQWIWPACFKVMFSNKANFFFGVSPAYVRNRIFETGMIGETPQPHAHNILLQIGVSLGVPAMVLYAFFLGSICVRCIRLIRFKTSPPPGKKDSGLWLVALIVLFLILIEMVEVMTFAINRINLSVFYIFTGWIVSADRSRSRFKKRKFRTKS